MQFLVLGTDMGTVHILDTENGTQSHEFPSVKIFILGGGASLYFFFALLTNGKVLLSALSLTFSTRPKSTLWTLIAMATGWPAVPMMARFVLGVCTGRTRNM